MNFPTKDPWTFVSGPEAVYNLEVFYESRGRFEPGGHFWTQRLCGNPEVPSDPEVVFRTLRSNKDPKVVWEPRGSLRPKGRI